MNIDINIGSDEPQEQRKKRKTTYKAINGIKFKENEIPRTNNQMLRAILAHQQTLLEATAILQVQVKSLFDMANYNDSYSETYIEKQTKTAEQLLITQVQRRYIEMQLEALETTGTDK